MSMMPVIVVLFWWWTFSSKMSCLMTVVTMIFWVILLLLLKFLLWRLMITCVSRWSASKYGDLLHSLGCLILSFGFGFTSHALKHKVHQDSFGCDSNIKMNEHSMFLLCQIISVALHGLRIYYILFYVPNQVENIPLLPKREIPPEI